MSEFKARITAELDTSKLEQDIKNLDGKIKIGVDTGKGTEDIGKVSKEIETATKKADGFGSSVKKAFAFGSAGKIAYETIRLVKDAIDNAVESVNTLDAAITDLRIATGEGYEYISSLVKEYNALGKSIGATTTDVTDAANTWLRQGYDVSNTNKLIYNSLILSKVGELESADAAKYLTSALKGYNVEAEKSISIIDKLTAIDITSAVDAGGLAEGMSKVATSANLVDISMDKLLGYLAVVGETTQKSMSLVGNSFQTIFSRMANVKSGMLEYINEDGVTESLSDVETVLNALGIKLRNTDGEFRNFGIVLDEVANGWESYSSVQQAAIAKAFAGTRQYENFIVLMENYGKATEYMEVSMNSAGTAEQKYEAYLDSLEAKTNSLQASFESLAFNTISKESIGGIIEATTAVVEFLDKTNLLKGTLAGFVTAGILKAFLSLKTGIASAAIQLNEFHSALQLVKAGNVGENEIQQLAKMTSNLSQSQLKAVLSSKSLTVEQRLAILTAQGMSQAEAQAALSTMGLATAEGTATGTTVTLSGALKGLWATLMANPLVLVIMAVTAAATSLFTISQKVKEEQQEAKQNAIDAANAAQSLSNEITELTTKYIELSKAVQTDESAKESLLSTQTELIEKLGLEQSEIDKLIEKYGSLSAAIQQASLDELKYAERDIRGGLNAYEEALLDAADERGLASKSMNHIIGSWDKKDTDINHDALEALVEAGYISSGSYGSRGFEWFLPDDGFDLSTIEGIKASHNRLGEMLDIVASTAGSDNETYQTIYDEYNRVTAALNEYNTAIGGLNTNLAQQFVLTESIGKELPTTKAAFDAYRQTIINSAVVSGEFVGSQTDIEDAIDSVLRSQSQFEDFYKETAENTESATSAIDIINSKINSFRNTINKLKTATDEYNESGQVSAETYNKVIALNEDYADLFDFSSGKISIAADEVDRLVDELIAEYGATLAANGATEAQITQMVALANSLSDVKEEAADVVDAIKDLADILQDAVDGTEMTVFETWELLENYPELASAITKTTNGYILEEAAVRELIKAKAELLGMEASEARMAARDNLINNANNVDSANNVDKIFADYYNKNGTNIKSFDEYVSAWESYYGKTASGNWVDGLQEYVEAIISDNSVNNVMNSLIEDMKNPDTLLKTETEENPISNAFDELEAIYSGRLQELDYLTNTYNNAIKSLENQGYDVPASYYEKLKEVEEEKIALLGEELTALTSKFQEAINAGEIEEGSKEFYDMNNAINSVKESIQASNLALQEYSNTIRDLEWKKFDDIQDEIKKITDESEFLLDLLDDKDMVDDKGKLTEHGNAAMGLHGMNYNVYMEQARRYADEITKIEQELASDKYNQDLIDRKDELLELQRESVLAAEEEKQAMIDLVTEGIEAELDALDELIDKYKDSLNSIKDLYDYQNKVSDITSEISTLQKQIIAYENDTSEEVKAHIQKLKVELQEANEELQETEYDQFIADQKKLLDNLYTDYETILNRRLDDVDTLIVDSINAINTNAADIKTTLETTAGSVGTTLSGKMDTIWTTSDEINKVVSAYSTNFDSTLGSANSNLGTIDGSINNGVTTISSGLTTVGSTLSTIDSDIGSVNTSIGNVNTGINSLAGKLDSIKTAIGQIDNSGDASNPTSGGTGGTIGGNDIKEAAPNTVYTDPNTTITEKPKAETKEETVPEVKPITAEEVMAQQIVKFGNASGSGMNAGKSGDNGIIKWNNKEYKVQNSGTTFDSSSTLYKAAVNVLGFADRQIFGYNGDIYGYLDKKIQKLEGRTLSSTGYNNFVADMKANYPAYANGGLADFTGLAWLDGTKTKPEMVLDSTDTANLIELKNILAQMASNDVSLSSGMQGFHNVETIPFTNPVGAFLKERAQQSINDHSVNVKQDIHMENHFEIDHVDDYNDLMTKIQSDSKFEKMIQAMTIGRLNGKSSNAKYNWAWK